MAPLPPEISTNVKTGSLDDLISELNIPRQNTIPPPATDQPGQTSQSDNFIQQPANQQFFTGMPDQQPGSAISDETATKFGSQITALVDNGSATLCSFISINEDKAKYKLTAGEKKDLTDAYAEVARKRGLSNMPPELAALLATVFIVGPNFRTAFQDRQINQIKKEMQKARAELEIMKDEIQQLKKQSVIQAEEIKATA